MALVKALGMRNARLRAIVVVCLFVLTALGAAFHFWPPPRPTEPFFRGLGPYSRKITTTSDAAQRYFDQGLAFFYGFNYTEAARSFEAAAACDPNCAMAYWGLAMALGERVNDPTAATLRPELANLAAGKALERAGRASAPEQALINAVYKRAESSAVLFGQPADQAYASAMRRAWKAFPGDPDIGALTARAIARADSLDVCLRPGYTPPVSEEVIRLFERVLSQDPDHPYALHLLIHAVEGTDQFERAGAAADRLRDYAPGISHMTHMPTHIDIRRGHWQQAVIASEKAIAADREYRRVVADPGLYRIFMLHNNHMLAYVASMQGQSQQATQAIQEMLAYIPDDYVAADPGRVDFLFAMPYELHLRFGRWDAMLAEPPPRKEFVVAGTFWHFARGVAHAAKRQLAEAKTDLGLFAIARRSVPPNAIFLKNRAAKGFEIAAGLLTGEIAYREGRIEEALTELRQAVRREDDLSYIEPPEWVQPARHVLGATLMDAGRSAEAETVYREDLRRHPENGWALFGLRESLRKQHKSAEADVVATRLKHAWQYADIKLTASCLCLPGKE